MTFDFDIAYTGEVLHRQIFYSTTWFGNGRDEFCKKMDSLAKEIKKLKTEEENIFPIQDKQEEMVALVQKEFTQQVLDEMWEAGDENYSTHNSGGDLEVDGEKIDLDKDFFGVSYKKWEEKLHKELDKHKWYVIYSCVQSEDQEPEFESDEREGKFDKKKLTMKDNCLHYDDLAFECDFGVGDGEKKKLELFVNTKGDKFSKVIEIISEEKKEENRIEFGEGFIYPDEKKYCFMKRSAADVEVKDETGNDSFTFTPGFGVFKDEFSDLQKYLVNYIKEKKLDWCDVEVEWLRHCHYEINPDTKELGEFLESSGIESDSWEWNPKTQEFDDYEYDDEEEEEEEE